MFFGPNYALPHSDSQKRKKIYIYEFQEVGGAPVFPTERMNKFIYLFFIGKERTNKLSCLLYLQSRLLKFADYLVMCSLYI